MAGCNLATFFFMFDTPLTKYYEIFQVLLQKHRVPAGIGSPTCLQIRTQSQGLGAEKSQLRTSRRYFQSGISMTSDLSSFQCDRSPTASCVRRILAFQQTVGSHSLATGLQSLSCSSIFKFFIFHLNSQRIQRQISPISGLGYPFRPLALRIRPPAKLCPLTDQQPS